MAYQKNHEVSERRGGPFPVQRKLWDMIYERGGVGRAAKAIGKRPEQLSLILDGKHDMKWEFVKALCKYLEIENPLEVIL